MINNDKIITTIIGSGISSYSGDNGLAISAQLKGPSCIHLDSAGRVLVCDTMNNRIRVVDSNSIITSLAGTGNKIFTGDKYYTCIYINIYI
jgi:hypothetical protein